MIKYNLVTMLQSVQVTACHFATCQSVLTLHNIELKIGKGAQLVRSAGTSVQLLGRDGSYAIIRLRSGQMRKVHVECRAVLGAVF